MKGKKMRKFQVRVRVMLHGAFTVEARSAKEAERVVCAKFDAEDIKIGDLGERLVRKVDCLGEIGDDRKVDFRVTNGKEKGGKR